MLLTSLSTLSIEKKLTPAAPPPHPPLRLLYPFHPTEHIPRLIMYVINLVPRVSGWYVILLHSSPQGGIIVRVCTFHLSSDVIY